MRTHEFGKAEIVSLLVLTDELENCLLAPRPKGCNYNKYVLLGTSGGIYLV